jgi:hypothetical protein
VRAGVSVVKLTSVTFVALLLPLVGCGGKEEQHKFSYTLGDEPAAGRSSIAGARSASGGVPLTGDAGRPDRGGDAGGGGRDAVAGEGGQAVSAGGEAAGAPAVDGGAAGMSEAGGTGGVGGVGGVGQKACASNTECPKPANACLTRRCSAGFCLTQNVPAGELYVLDTPPDCHATSACDGLGHPTLVVDQSNAATPNNPCLVGTCNKSGAIGSEPLRSGARCSADFGPGKCDGQGTCVACLVTADCLLGQACTAYHACVGPPCSDTNCGGACPACVIGKPCTIDGDCVTNACDGKTQLCIADHQCANGRQDGNETDLDCGGQICPQCGVGKACLANIDCASFACDAVTLRCVADACVDGRMDGDESDLDCGGTGVGCSLCGVGKKCHSNFDCVPGHFCSGSRVCQ